MRDFLCYMRYAKYAIVSKGILEDPAAMKYFMLDVVKKIKASSVNAYRKVLNTCIQLSDQDGTNFMENKVTIIVTVDSYKAPRIVKRIMPNLKLKKLIKYLK